VSVTFEDMPEEERSELLLSYAKGRLPTEKCAEIDAAAVKSPRILEELEYYKGLARAAALDTDTMAAPGELGWARLSRDLDQLELETAAPIAANDNSRVWRYAAMALGLVVMGQFAALFTQSTNTQDARYIPVSEKSAEFAAQITFAPEASEVAIRTLLVSAEANIIAGPSSLGIYQLGFANEQQRKLGLEKLVAASDIIESALVAE